MNRRNNLRMRVPKNRRTPRTDEVYVFVAVSIIDVGAGCTGHKGGRAAYGVESAYGGVYPAGDYGTGAFKKLFAVLVCEVVFG